MEIGAGGIRKKDRVVTIKVTTKDIETRIKSDHTPFSRSSPSSSSNNSNPNNSSSTSTQPRKEMSRFITHGSRIGKTPQRRYPTKTPYQDALDLTERASENWERIIAEGPRRKQALKTKKNKLTAKECTSRWNSKNKPLMQASHISYNRTIIDLVEKGRYSHPNYNVDHLVSRKTEEKQKIDARYGE